LVLAAGDARLELYGREQPGKEGGITLGTSAYHAVLAVKDERGKRSPPAAVFDP